VLKGLGAIPLLITFVFSPAWQRVTPWWTEFLYDLTGCMGLLYSCYSSRKILLSKQRLNRTCYEMDGKIIFWNVMDWMLGGWDLGTVGVRLGVVRATAVHRVACSRME
jgi:hypothetical protein